MEEKEMTPQRHKDTKEPTASGHPMVFPFEVSRCAPRGSRGDPRSDGVAFSGVLVEKPIFLKRMNADRRGWPCGRKGRGSIQICVSIMSCLSTAGIRKGAARGALRRPES